MIPSPPSFNLPKTPHSLRSQNSTGEHQQGILRFGQTKKYIKYKANYNSTNQFDIQNKCYQAKQAPESFDPQQITKISTNLSSLLKYSPQQQKSSTPSKINFAFLNKLQQPHLSQVKIFFFSILTHFISNHPYCSFDGMLSILHLHLEQNNKIYFPSGTFNLPLFKENNALNQLVDMKSPFFLSILQQLQRMVTVFINQFCALIFYIPPNFSTKFLTTPIIQNIWKSFKQLYNADYILNDKTFSHELIAIDLMNTLITLQNKSPNIFGKDIVKNMVQFLDKHVVLITRGFYTKRVLSSTQDRSPPIILSKKCIILLSSLLLNHPYQHPKWDDQLKKLLRSSKSIFIYPFTWLILDKKSSKTRQIKINKSRFDDHYDEQYQPISGNRYFILVGKQWMGLLKELIINLKQNSSLSINQFYKNTIFYLMCSIIQENPIAFWTNVQQYQIIYDYISQIYSQMIESPQNTSTNISAMGKLSRIMLCASGKLTLSNDPSQISPQLISTFNQDSIMLRVIASQSSSTFQSLSLANLVYNKFITNILTITNPITPSQLFGSHLMRCLLQTNQQQFPFFINLNNLTQIQAKYNYQLPNVIYQLFIKLMIDNPRLITIFMPLWKDLTDDPDDQDDRQKYSNNNNQKQYYIRFLCQFTLDYMIKVYQYCSTKIGHPVSRNQTSSYSNYQKFQILPLIFNLLTNLLQNPYTKQYTLSLLKHQKLINNRKLKQLLQKSIYYKSNLLAITNHVEHMYQLQLQHLQWISQICANAIQGSFTLWQIEVVRHFANIARIVLVRNYLSSSTSSNNQYKIGMSNILSLNPQVQLLQSLSSLNINIDSTSNSYIKIPQLSKHQQYLLQFIIWALKIQQDGLRKFTFYNSLYINKKYQTLQSALKLLEVLIIVNMKYQNRIYITEKMRRFITFTPTTNHYISYTNSSTNPIRKMGTIPQIQLSNKQIATLPAALVYLIITPYFLPTLQTTQHSTSKSKQIRSLALNILNIILTSSHNSLAMLSPSNDKNTTNQIQREDPISNINLNIYQQYFVYDQQNIYCSCKQYLIDYLSKQLSTKTQTLSLSPLSWYQSSYLNGQYIDILTQINKLFFSPTITKSLIDKANRQIQNGEKLSQQMQKILTRQQLFELPLTSINSWLNKDIFPSNLTQRPCDRQLLAYSRYILQLSTCYNQSQTTLSSYGNKQSKQQVQGNQIYNQIQDILITILNLIVGKLIIIINEQVQCQIKMNIVQSISTNIWKTFRILQTKKPRQFFTTIICKYLPFILHQYHFNILNPQYIKQYLLSIKLILGCKQYLNKYIYNKIKQQKYLKQMLLKLMRSAATKPKYYTILFYCLNLYTQLTQQQSQLKNDLTLIYQIINQTINPFQYKNLKKLSISSKLTSPNKQQLIDLSKDIGVISIMMFFKLHLPQWNLIQNQTDKKSLYQLLLAFEKNSSFTSLLISMQLSPTQKSIELALNIGNNSNHFIDFISACNHLYSALALHQSNTLPLQPFLIQHIYTFTQRVLNRTLKPSSQSWRTLAYMKSWVCNILSLMTSQNSSKTILIKISDLMFTSHHSLELLGQLLTLYQERKINWPFLSGNNIGNKQFGLLEKQLLLSLLKIYMCLIAKNDDWNQKNVINLTNKNTQKYKQYLTFCRALVSNSKILTLSTGTSTITNPKQVNKAQTNPSRNTATSQYQQILQKLTLQYIYRSTSSPSHLKSTHDYPQHIDKSHINLLHPQCSTVLDIIHDHYNLLIIQKYLMILLGCYSNPDLIFQTYQFNDILTIFQLVSKRLLQINQNFKIYQNFINQIDHEIWNNFRMNVNLYYLNTIQESPKSTVNILNNIAEICMNCIVVLKCTMEMHKDYRQFCPKVDKLMRQAKKSIGNYLFDIKQYIERSGFDNKSQYGTSFMMSPSTYRMSR